MERSATALKDAASELGVILSPTQLGQLLSHVQLLERWNRTHNLVGPGTPETWLERHTLDSLAAAPQLPAGSGDDVGSGAGFPGIPLAIARPDCRFTLYEPREKRGAFLSNAIATLGLKNATVFQRHLEPRTEPGEARFAVSRATLQLPEWLDLAATLLGPGGLAVAFLGLENWDQASLNAAAAGAGLVEARLQRYQIRGQPARTLALLRHP